MNENDAKKLFLHSLLSMEMESKPPMTTREEKTYLNKFEEPDFQDEIAFLLSKERHEPGMLFSRDALEKFLHIIRLYVGGRIIGNFNKTGREPEVLRVTLTVEHLTHKEFKNESEHC